MLVLSTKGGPLLVVVPNGEKANLYFLCLCDLDLAQFCFDDFVTWNDLVNI